MKYNNAKNIKLNCNKSGFVTNFAENTEILIISKLFISFNINNNRKEMRIINYKTCVEPGLLLLLFIRRDLAFTQLA